jgi:hypothetical protein
MLAAVAERVREAAVLVRAELRQPEDNPEVAFLGCRWAAEAEQLVMAHRWAEAQSMAVEEGAQLISPAARSMGVRPCPAEGAAGAGAA